MTPEQRKAFNKYVGIVVDEPGSRCGSEIAHLAEIEGHFIAGWNAHVEVCWDSFVERFTPKETTNE